MSESVRHAKRFVGERANAKAHRAWPLACACIAFPLCSNVLAYDINDQLSVTGSVGGVYQYQDLRGNRFDNVGRGVLSAESDISFRPWADGKFSSRLSVASGNGLNDITPFTLSPWGADLQDDIEDINGSGRSYLLTAWYKHTFSNLGAGNLGVTAGLIKSADYLDLNAYANDEYGQFLNQVFINSVVTPLPAYDYGGLVEWRTQVFSVKLVAMNVFENDDGNNYNYLGSTLGYTSHNTLGEGNYRITVGATSSEFLDPSETQTHSLRGVTLSLDQEFGENIGGFLRIGWQDQDAAVDFGALYSGGLTIAGRYWNRPNDSVGLGYAYLSGGNTGIDKTQVFEGYYSLALGRYLTLTGDVQYMNEELDTTKGPEGWILGLRAVAQF